MQCLEYLQRATITQSSFCLILLMYPGKQSLFASSVFLMPGELICALKSRICHVLYQVQVLQKGNINFSLNAHGITHAQ